ncbi:putative molibdopterin-dependent oxidoreductase YjgC [Herbaspirillum sp. Sphag1AN]|uniref:(2Fe-2S)-binding protein n=1 Tax=unclassified Herbaspirillum TaxID=2624150 RepID=UPI001618D8C3|nr:MULTISPECIES: (2Fe-2S)-binding protein [unclassified Herbaspirillum]MBB3212449.1 putative molibdopterin-dependent oxidoreductase YjgC [Herbaspirillum sp. Sphag1AN]MBB3245452.1 putative molibdopterin-dependent oxidoreductase YjgC [Herbaspirillum sp. Sphag64]
MFKTMLASTEELRPLVEIVVDGRSVQAREGEMLAAALLNAGVVPFRHTAISGQPRAPLCLMGVCFDCLVEVDGVQNTQSCMIEVHAGMTVRLQDGARRVGDVK